MLVDVVVVDQAFANEDVCNAVEERNVGAWFDGKMEIGHHGGLGDARVDYDELARFGAGATIDAVTEDGVVVRDVGADEEDDIGVFHVGVGAGWTVGAILRQVAGEEAEGRNRGRGIATSRRRETKRPAGVRRVPASTPTMAGFRDRLAEMEFLHEISSRMAPANSLHLVLDRIVDFIASVIPCDSCFIYVLEGENLMLRASKNPHADLIDHIKVQIGQELIRVG